MGKVECTIVQWFYKNCSFNRHQSQSAKKSSVAGLLQWGYCQVQSYKCKESWHLKLGHRVLH